MPALRDRHALDVGAAVALLVVVENDGLVGSLHALRRAAGEEVEKVRTDEKRVSGERGRLASYGSKLLSP